jgi:hypothetical protein
MAACQENKTRSSADGAVIEDAPGSDVTILSGTGGVGLLAGTGGHAGSGGIPAGTGGRVDAGGDGGKKLTPEQATAAGAMCSRAKDCGLVTSSELQQCKEQIAGALQIFPDPDAFAACVQAMTCSDLANADTDSISACLDLDYDTITCSTDSSTQLGGCSNTGKCTTVNCPDSCDLLGGTFAYCGYDSARGWDVCWCRQ